MYRYALATLIVFFSNAVSVRGADTVPSNLPKRAAQAVAEAKRWQSDAALERIMYSPGTYVPVTFYLHSMKAKQGRVMFDSGNGSFTSKEIAMDPTTPAIGVDFVDLPVAVTAARRAGLNGPINVAFLSATSTSRGLVTAWHVGSYVVKAADGTLIPASSLDDPFREADAHFRRNQAERAAQRAAQAYDGLDANDQKVIWWKSLSRDAHDGWCSISKYSWTKHSYFDERQSRWINLCNYK